MPRIDPSRQVSMFPSIFRLFRCQKCPKIKKIVQKIPKISESVRSELTRMYPNVPKRIRMGPNTFKNLKKV